MKKLFLLLTICATTLFTSAQDSTKTPGPDTTATPADTTSLAMVTTDQMYHGVNSEIHSQPAAPVTTDTTVKASKTSHEVLLATRNIARGVNFGNSPIIGAKVRHQICSVFELGVNATVTTNGSVAGFGNQLNIFGKIKITDNIGLIVTDYFFFGPGANDYFFETGKDSSNGHFQEAALQYKDDKFRLLGGYCFNATKFDSDANTGIYFEAEYNFTPNFSGSLGYITDKSALNFYEKSGFTTVGMTYAWDQIGGRFKTSLIFNPNYKNVSPDVTASPATAVIAFVF
jgi:hypothetical protein